MLNAAVHVQRWLKLFESALAALAYSIVALLLIADVLGRELFGQALFGAQKMAVFAAIVAGFLGLSLATNAGSHLRPGFLDNLFPARFDSLIWRLADALSSLIYLTLTAVAIQFILVSMAAGDRAAVLYWTLWPIQLVIPYAFFSSAIQHAIFAIWPQLKPKSDVTSAH